MFDVVDKADALIDLVKGMFDMSFRDTSFYR